MVDDANGVSITKNEMPAFFFKERIVNSTAEIAQTICLQRHDDLEEIPCSDLGFVVYLEVALSIYCWEIFDALFYVSRSVAVKEIQKVSSLFFILDQSFQVLEFLVFLLLGDFVDFLSRQVKLSERVSQLEASTLDEVLLEENQTEDAKLTNKVRLSFDHF